MELIQHLDRLGWTKPGSASMACEQIERLQKQSGGFGCYLCLAHEWANPEATRRRYELIARRVFPEFQGHAAATRNAKERARARREPLAERDMKAVEEMVAKHEAELAAKDQRPSDTVRDRIRPIPYDSSAEVRGRGREARVASRS